MRALDLNSEYGAYLDRIPAVTLATVNLMSLFGLHRRLRGAIVGHLADGQYEFCSVALGEKDPEPKVEQTKTSKADLIAALKTAFAYCDKAYDGMTDSSGSQIVKLFGTDTPKLGALNFNNVHNWEHYGNLVTYMRIKNIVPPTSEQTSPPPVPPQKQK